MTTRVQQVREECAICWPAQYLGRSFDLVQAVDALALAHALERDICGGGAAAFKRR